MTNLRDLKKDLEYLKSDKKMAADKQRELQQKMAEIKRLQDKARCQYLTNVAFSKTRISSRSPRTTMIWNPSNKSSER